MKCICFEKKILPFTIFGWVKLIPLTLKVWVLGQGVACNSSQNGPNDLIFCISYYMQGTFLGQYCKIFENFSIWGFQVVFGDIWFHKQSFQKYLVFFDLQIVIFYIVFILKQTKIKMVVFLLKNGHFIVKNGHLIMKNGCFLEKLLFFDFLSFFEK